MYFFERNEAYTKRIACIDDTGKGYTYEELCKQNAAVP